MRKGWRFQKRHPASAPDVRTSTSRFLGKLIQKKFICNFFLHQPFLAHKRSLSAVALISFPNIRLGRHESSFSCVRKVVRRLASRLKGGCGCEAFGPSPTLRGVENSGKTPARTPAKTPSASRRRSHGPTRRISGPIGHMEEFTDLQLPISSFALRRRPGVATFVRRVDEKPRAQRSCVCSRWLLYTLSYRTATSIVLKRGCEKCHNCFRVETSNEREALAALPIIYRCDVVGCFACVSREDSMYVVLFSCAFDRLSCVSLVLFNISGCCTVKQACANSRICTVINIILRSPWSKICLEHK